MRFSINITRLVFTLFVAYLSLKHQCQSVNTTMTSVNIDDSVERFPRGAIKSLNKPSSSIFILRHQSPDLVLRIISRMSRKNIDELYLENNELTKLPRTLNILTNIETVSLADNKITDIANISVVNELPRLRYLVLSRNPLKSIRGLKIGSLEILVADNCKIKEIDGSLRNSMPALRALNLTGNILGTVREMISESLIELVLKKCQLTHLYSEAFRGLTNLMYLNLEENQLSTMPDTIFLKNNKLHYLNLGKNRFKIIRNVWFNVTRNLEILHLFKNEIMSINETDFAALPNLDKLDLAENRVTTFSNLETAALDVNLSKNSIKNNRLWDLSKMTRIRRLDLSHNRLEGNCGVFRSKSLGILILGHNKLTTLTKDSVADLPNLSDMSLKGNKISAGINPTVFQDNPNLVNVELDDNPWSCNCTQLYPIYFYLASGQRTKTSHLICDSPRNASGHTWWQYCGNNWRTLIIVDDHVERGTTWIIAISGTFGTCIIFGTMIYITYTYKKNRPVETRDETI